ncbi:hypothetical protein JKP88DRAFT_241839 [Tribonema minus]|uniref:Uncharacterized protein n=1 Tax=Tribonema minus TaxID=303371 RepID=A0A835YRN3_9STRA|nr:hypothetical protein JKP88DRAFT_241839 [Tribonema minus]
MEHATVIRSLDCSSNVKHTPPPPLVPIKILPEARSFGGLFNRREKIVQHSSLSQSLLKRCCAMRQVFSLEPVSADGDLQCDFGGATRRVTQLSDGTLIAEGLAAEHAIPERNWGEVMDAATPWGGTVIRAASAADIAALPPFFRTWDGDEYKIPRMYSLEGCHEVHSAQDGGAGKFNCVLLRLPMGRALVSAVRGAGVQSARRAGVFALTPYSQLVTGIQPRHYGFWVVYPHVAGLCGTAGGEMDVRTALGYPHTIASRAFVCMAEVTSRSRFVPIKAVQAMLASTLSKAPLPAPSPPQQCSPHMPQCSTPSVHQRSASEEPHQCAALSDEHQQCSSPDAHSQQCSAPADHQHATPSEQQCSPPRQMHMSPAPLLSSSTKGAAASATGCASTREPAVKREVQVDVPVMRDSAQQTAQKRRRVGAEGEMAAAGIGNSETLVDLMHVLHQREWLPLDVMQVNKALYEGTATNVNVEVWLNAACRRKCTIALASTFVRRCIVKLHLFGHFCASLQQVQPLGWSAIKSLMLYKFKGGITVLPPNLEQLSLNRTVLDAKMMRMITTTAPASLRTLKLLRCPIVCHAKHLNLPGTLRTFVCARYLRGSAELSLSARTFCFCLPEGLKRHHLDQWDVPDGASFPASLQSLHLQQCVIGYESHVHVGAAKRRSNLPHSERREGVRLPERLRTLALACCDFNCGFGDLPPSLVDFTANGHNPANLSADEDDRSDARAGDPCCIPSSALYTMCHPFVWSLAPLPPGLVRLDLGDFLSCRELPSPLPRALEYLHISDGFNGRLESLPASLKTLVLGYHYDTRLDALPARLMHLCLGCKYNHPLGPLPDTLEQLETYDYGEFNHDLGPLPSSLRVLRLTGNFAQPLPRLLEGLRELRVGRSFNHPLTSLPSTLETLFIESLSYDHSIEPVPVSLTHVRRRVGHYFNVIDEEYRDGVRVTV